MVRKLVMLATVSRSAWGGSRSQRNTNRRFQITATLLVGICFASGFAYSQSATTPPHARHAAPPPWAYANNPADKISDAKEISTDPTPRHVPDSTASFTLAQVADFYNPPDWHPTDHPAMPDIVAHGRAPDVYACGYCHLPNGQGRPENASLSGLSVGYMMQQLVDFKGGTRQSSVPNRRPGVAMVGIAAKATEKEMLTAAKYFSSLKPNPWIRVVETATVPKTRVSGWMLVPAAAHATEPIGQRIIEMPEKLEATELRDDHSGFVAYVPLGSIKRGKALAESGGGGKTLQCSICHGPELKGMGKTPALAGRSPSYLVRQLYDMQSGARNGSAAQSMKPVVEKLTIEDMVSLAAYTASLNP